MLTPFALPALALASLSSTIESPSPAQPSPSVAALIKAENQLAIGLYRELDDAPGNIVCSPTSVARVLGMLREAAEGATAREIETLLALAPAEPPDIFRALNATIGPPPAHKRDAGPAYHLESGAALWVDQRLKLVPDGLERLRNGFDSRAETVDFRSPETVRGTVNKWAEELTHGHVPELLPPGIPDADGRAILTDAVWFRASWADPFKTEATQPAPFLRESTTPVDVPMMRRTGDMPYAETERAQIVAIPFQRGFVELLLVLPKKGVPLADVTAHEDFRAWTEKLERTKVALTLPRFAAKMHKDLKVPLQTLGVRAAFDPAQSSFTRLVSNEPLVIDAVIHGARIVVDENGAEAAAATAAVAKYGSAAKPAEPKVFVADHPFLFAIRHKSSGSVIFFGRVADPSVE